MWKDGLLLSLTFFCLEINFPQVNWNTGVVCGVGSSADERKSAQLLFRLVDELCLAQVIEEPTKGSNILYLVLVNNCDLVYNYEVRDTGIFDHRLIMLFLIWPNMYLLRDFQRRIIGLDS